MNRPQRMCRRKQLSGSERKLDTQIQFLDGILDSNVDVGWIDAKNGMCIEVAHDTQDRFEVLGQIPVNAGADVEWSKKRKYVSSHHCDMVQSRVQDRFHREWLRFEPLFFVFDKLNAVRNRLCLEQESSSSSSSSSLQ